MGLGIITPEGAQIQNYFSVFPNRVYVKDFILGTPDGVIPMQYILTLGRYTEPTEEQVVEKVQSTVKQILMLDSLCMNYRPKTNLETSIFGLSEMCSGILEAIVDGESDILNFIRMNNGAPPYRDDIPSNQYLHLKLGVVNLNSVIERVFNSGKIENAQWFESLLSDESLKKMGLGITSDVKILLKEGYLPDKNIINVLLGNGTSMSNTLEISGYIFDYDEIKRIIDDVYRNFKSRLLFEEIEDISDSILENEAITVVEAIKRQLVLSRMEQSLQHPPQSIKMLYVAPNSDSQFVLSLIKFYTQKGLSTYSNERKILGKVCMN